MKRRKDTPLFGQRRPSVKGRVKLDKWVLDDLRRSGLTASDAKLAGIRQFTADESAALIPKIRKGTITCPSYGFPYNGSGDFNLRFQHELNFDDSDKGIRYLQTFNGSQLYIPPRLEEAETVYMTEGEKKAELLCKRGLCATAIGGVWNAYKKRPDNTSPFVLLDAIQAFADNKDVVLVLDSDYSENEQVRKAEKTLISCLNDGVARSVSVVRFPREHGKGIDDAIVNQKISTKAKAAAYLQKYTIPAEEIKAPDSTDDQAIIELARLSKFDYDRRRKTDADKLGVRVATLDELVVSKRVELGLDDSNSSFGFGSIEPWPDPVNGTDLLNEIANVVSRFAIVPPHADTVLALWLAFTFMHDAAYTCPMLGVMSPEKRCGKSTVLGLLSQLAHRPLAASNISAAALFRAIEKWQPTLIVDEADTFLHNSDELRGVLNSGHTRDTAFVVRTVGDNHEPTSFSTWSPKAFASIGKLPDTLQDRSIVVWLQRKTIDQKVEKRRRHHDKDFYELKRKLVRWAKDNSEAYEQASYEDISGLNDRAADNWEPLLQLAKLAGGDWLARAKKAAVAISGSADSMGEDSIRIELLLDIRRIFEQRKVKEVSSNDLVTDLIVMEDRPWPEYKRNGQPITVNQVARLLRPFCIKSTHLRIKGAKYEGAKTQKRGYRLEMFVDAFNRYLPPAPL